MDDQVEHLMVWGDDLTPPDDITGKWSNNGKEKKNLTTSYVFFSFLVC